MEIEKRDSSQGIQPSQPTCLPPDHLLALYIPNRSIRGHGEPPVKCSDCRRNRDVHSGGMLGKAAGGISDVVGAGVESGRKNARHKAGAFCKLAILAIRDQHVYYHVHPERVEKGSRPATAPPTSGRGGCSGGAREIGQRHDVRAAREVPAAEEGRGDHRRRQEAPARREPRRRLARTLQTQELVAARRGARYGAGHGARHGNRHRDFSRPVARYSREAAPPVRSAALPACAATRIMPCCSQVPRRCGSRVIEPVYADGWTSCRNTLHVVVALREFASEIRPRVLAM